MKNQNVSAAIPAADIPQPGKRTNKTIEKLINKTVALRWRLAQIRESGVAFDCSRRSACIYLALFVVVISAVLLLNSDWLSLIPDTMLLFLNFDSLERFSSLWSDANANPLQALFDIFPSGQRLDAIPNLIANALFGPGTHVSFFYVFCAVLLTLSVVAMARSVEIRSSVAVLAGILLPFMIMPTVGHVPLAEDLYILWPILYYSVAGTTLATALFWRVGRSSWRRSALLTAVIVIILLHLSMIQILHMTMMTPALLAMGAAALAASTSRIELTSKIICAIVIVAALGVAGIFQYLYATGINGAQYVFYNELPVFMNFARPHLEWVIHDLGEVFFNPLSPTFNVRANAIGAVMVPLSQLGAVYLALLGQTRAARIFGRAMIVWIAATALSVVLLHNYYYYTGLVYLGPDPRHFVEILWPYYVICSASLIFAAVEYVAGMLSRAGLLSARTLKYVPHGLVLLALTAALTPIAVRALPSWTPPQPPLPDSHAGPPYPYFHYYEPNAVVDFLAPRIGISVDREFRGSAIFMPTVYDKDLKPYPIWRREMTFTFNRIYLGNDLGTYGLRHYNIPTLDEVTHNITPQFYLITRELLSRPGIDIFDRHFGGAATRLNEPILALLGVRYVIADYEPPIGAERFAMPIPENARRLFEANKVSKSPLRIYELPNANVGNFSPTEIIRAKTAKETILAMSRPDFDGRRMVVTSDLSLPGNLVPAEGAAMTVRLGGVALSASSAGQSVLVLPVQFSHCWRIVSGNNATLFRANLMQLGVLFSGELRLELRQIFGPFGNSACRIVDAADAERLRMLDAAGTVADENKPAGDGINLIPDADALDQVIGDSPIASIKAVGASDAPLRAYKIAAEGWSIRRKEHYLTLTIPKLAPGVYTLSMQVRAKETRFMALQMTDGANNGAYVDYLPSERQFWIYKIGEGDKLDATVRAIDDQWFQITLTSALSTETGNRIFIRLKDRGNDGAFRSWGQAITIRAVKLERGEKATPYNEFSASPRRAMR